MERQFASCILLGIQAFVKVEVQTSLSSLCWSFSSQARKGLFTKKDKVQQCLCENLSESTTDDDLKKTFGEYGTITSAVVMRDADGKSKCFGFINFESMDDAANDVDALNGKKIDDKEWYVSKAQKKSERA
ncbi:polyadenylate-binding protein 2-like protein [Tanacetum coccineum]